MVAKKYQIGLRRFGLVNWVGLKSLYIKEVSRFLIVWAQTLLSPLVSSLLFLSVLSLAIGNERGEVLGYSFISYCTVKKRVSKSRCNQMTKTPFFPN